MKKGLLTCGGVFVLLMFLMLGGLLFGLNSLFDSFKDDYYKDMGFSSQKEYDEFISVFSKDVNSVSFYENTYKTVDKQFVDSLLMQSIELKDGSSLFLQNGNLNITALDKKNNSQLKEPMDFTSQQFAYLENLLCRSVLDEESISNELSELQVLSYNIITETKHSATLKLNTAKLKKALDQYGKALPSDLYIVINYDIIIDANGKYKATNQTIKFNNHEEKVNKQATNYFKTILQAEPQKVFSDIIMTLINSFNNTLNIKTNFTLEGIRMEAYNEA